MKKLAGWELISIIIVVFTQPGGIFSCDRDKGKKTEPTTNTPSPDIVEIVNELNAHLMNDDNKNKALELGITLKCLRDIPGAPKDFLDKLTGPWAKLTKKQKKEQAFLIYTKSVDEMFQGYKVIVGVDSDAASKLEEIRIKAPTQFLKKKAENDANSTKEITVDVFIAQINDFYMNDMFGIYHEDHQTLNMPLQETETKPASKPKAAPKKRGTKTQ